MIQPFTNTPLKIAVLGLGYVGLPLAVAFGHKFDVVGFDINASRVKELRSGVDRTLEVKPVQLASSKGLSFSSDLEDLKSCNVFIVTVPTPIDVYKRPDLSPLIAASRMLGGVIGRGAVVVYESTVYPGCTEEDCVPILEKVSGLRFNEDFYAGYSPERANPGDAEHTVATITKVTAGSTEAAADFVDGLYASIVTAGTHKASSIRVAEAAKVIENTQRDLNIALMNELSIIFSKMDIDTLEVLAAAGTKWNFLPFRPGLVGGHCIGVDPYYLTHKAEALGYHPQVILAGRRINDGMGAHVASGLVKEMIRRGICVKGARILVMGFAFKENCPDLRNTRVIDIVQELKGYNADVSVWDPWVDAEEARHEYGLELVDGQPDGGYDAIVLAVAHDQFRQLGAEKIRQLGAPNAVLFDVKSLLPKGQADLRL